MGGITDLFVSPEEMPHNGFGIIQLLFQLFVYAYILGIGSNYISDGSELLLLVPSWSKMIGAIVLPVICTVPDAVIVLFSGLGDNAQEELNIGMGALAGSTVMLHTIPWATAIIAGRVNVENGECQYKRPPGASKTTWKKLDPPDRIRGTGVCADANVPYIGKVMMFTAIPFLIMQIPAFTFDCYLKKNEEECNKSGEFGCAIAALVLSIVNFIGYLIDQVRLANNHNPVMENRISAVREKALVKSLVSLHGLFAEDLVSQGGSPPDKDSEPFRHAVKAIFHRFDDNTDGLIDREEMCLLLKELGEPHDKAHVDALFSHVDKDKSGSLDYEEFLSAISEALKQHHAEKANSSEQPVKPMEAVESSGHKHEAEEEEDEEEECEMPEDLCHLSPAEQQSRLKRRSFLMMAWGILLVVLFSDPAVEILNELSKRIHIPAFYVAFVVCPLASNASEFIASYNYALKKTEKTTSIALVTLMGAACMNNTMCLAVFLVIIIAKDLKWVFAAETMVIFLVEIGLCVVAHVRIQHWWMSLVVMSFLPLSLIFVAVLEEAGGLN